MESNGAWLFCDQRYQGSNQTQTNDNKTQPTVAWASNCNTCCSWCCCFGRCCLIPTFAIKLTFLCSLNPVSLLLLLLLLLHAHLSANAPERAREREVQTPQYVHISIEFQPQPRRALNCNGVELQWKLMTFWPGLAFPALNLHFLPASQPASSSQSASKQSGTTTRSRHDTGSRLVKR